MIYVSKKKIEKKKGPRNTKFEKQEDKVKVVAMAKERREVRMGKMKANSNGEERDDKGGNENKNDRGKNSKYI